MANYYFAFFSSKYGDSLTLVEGQGHHSTCQNSHDIYVVGSTQGKRPIDFEWPWLKVKVIIDQNAKTAFGPIYRWQFAWYRQETSECRRQG